MYTHICTYIHKYLGNCILSLVPFTPPSICHIYVYIYEREGEKREREGGWSYFYVCICIY